MTRITKLVYFVCRRCMWFDTGDFCHSMYGHCTCDNSEHRQHVLTKEHRACEEFGTTWDVEADK